MLFVEQQAVILYDPVKTTQAAIRENIEDAGYAIVASDDEEAVVETANITQQLQPGITTGRQDILHIENMDCPTEEALIRNKLTGFPSVTGLEFNLLQRNLTIYHTLPSLDPVISRQFFTN
jgi:Cd2+/Zn2+-exporting ATPase